jgi:hypothetical protein
MSREELRTAMYCANRAGKSCQATARVWVAGQPHCKRSGGRASKMICGILDASTSAYRFAQDPRNP